MSPRNLSLKLLVLLSLLFLLPLPAESDRTGWNEPGRAPGYSQGELLRINSDFFDLAANTGGDFYFWAPGEFAASAGLLDVPISSEAIGLAYGSKAGLFSQTMEVPVDSTISQLSVFAGAQRLDGIKLLRPDGRTVEENPAGVINQVFQHMRIVTVDDPEPGQWRVELSGSGSYELATRYLAKRSRLRQRGLNGIDLIGFDFVELRGRPGHQGLFPLQEAPKAGRMGLCRLSLSGGVEQPAIELISSTGIILGTVRLERHPDAAADEFIGSVRVPDRPFRVRVRGKDTEGWPFQRLTAGLTTPAKDP